MYFVSLRMPEAHLNELIAVPMRIRNLRLCAASRADAEWLCKTMNMGGIPVSSQAKS